jgi:tetratricopeptide (TPR) repeat protein
VCYWEKGELKKLYEIGKTLLEYGQRHANIRSQTMGHMMLGGAHYLFGDFSNYIQCLQNALEVSADTMYDNCAKAYLGLGYILNDQIHDAEELLTEVVSFSKEYEFDWAGMPAQVFLGVVTIAKGNMTAGFNMIEDARKSFVRENRKYFIALTEYVLAKIYAQIVEGAGPINILSLAKNIGFLIKNVPFADKKAISHFENAIAVSKEIDSKSVLGPAYLDLGLLHSAKKRSEQAKEYISKAIRIFEEWEAQIYLKQAQEALAYLS